MPENIWSSEQVKSYFMSFVSVRWKLASLMSCIICRSILEKNGVSSVILKEFIILFLERNVSHHFWIRQHILILNSVESLHQRKCYPQMKGPAQTTTLTLRKWGKIWRVCCPIRRPAPRWEFHKWNCTCRSSCTGRTDSLHVITYRYTVRVWLYHVDVLFTVVSREGGSGEKRAPEDVDGRWREGQGR